MKKFLTGIMCLSIIFIMFGCSSSKDSSNENVSSISEKFNGKIDEDILDKLYKVGFGEPTNFTDITLGSIDMSLQNPESDEVLRITSDRAGFYNYIMGDKEEYEFELWYGLDGDQNPMVIKYSADNYKREITDIDNKTSEYEDSLEKLLEKIDLNCSELAYSLFSQSCEQQYKIYDDELLKGYKNIDSILTSNGFKRTISHDQYDMYFINDDEQDFSLVWNAEWTKTEGVSKYTFYLGYKGDEERTFYALLILDQIDPGNEMELGQMDLLTGDGSLGNYVIPYNNGNFDMNSIKYDSTIDSSLYVTEDEAAEKVYWSLSKFKELLNNLGLKLSDFSDPKLFQ